MVSKKGIIIFVVVAIVLATVAISLRLVDSNEVPTSISENQTDELVGNVGVTIIQSKFEDKLADDPEGGST